MSLGSSSDLQVHCEFGVLQECVLGCRVSGVLGLWVMFDLGWFCFEVCC